MVVNGRDQQQVSITIKGQTLQVVKEFKYVGSTESEDSTMTREVERRIQMMAAAYSRLRKNVFDEPHIRKETKLMTYRTMVLSNGLYACATWNAPDHLVQKMESWQYRTLRAILGYKWQHRISYKRILYLCVH